MNVLTFSLDKSILEKDSAVQKRILSLAEKAGEISVFVTGEKDERLELSKHLIVYSFGGSKPVQFGKMWRVGKKLLTPTGSSISPLQRERHHLASPTRHSSSTEEEKRGEEDKRFDLVTVQDVYFLGFLAARLAQKFSVPFEVQVHGLEKFDGMRKRIALGVLRKATRIRAVSQRLRALAVELGVPSDRIYTLPVYTQIDPVRSRGTLRALAASNGAQKIPRRKTVPYPFTFLTVGRLVPVKNITMQIRAFAKLAKKIPHVQLRVVGDGPERSNLQLSIINYQLEGKVVLEGEQRDVGKYYEEADAFLLTSDSEGWGRVVLEAAAHRLPTIMTNVGLANEVIHHDKEGVVIPVGDEEQLTFAMQDLVDKPELREELGEAAFQAFKKLPSQEEHIQKQVEEWQKIINRK